jgi:transcriptional regulator with XRE-family HTH domain
MSWQDLSTLGRTVRRLRGRHQWTQAELASRAGVSRNTVVLYESGELVRPRQDVLQRLADARGVDVQDLMA